MFMFRTKSCFSGTSKRKACERVVLFTRYPQPGKTKTRLIAVLGEDGAAGLQRQMTEHVLGHLRRLAAYRQTHLEIRYEGGSRDAMQRWLGPELDYCPQGQGDLGDRMARALLDALEAGMERCLIIGADCPGLTQDILRLAFELLSQKDLVLGPSRDGGYYLIGAGSGISSSRIRSLFRDIAWGTSEVLEQTLHIARNLRLTFGLLETLDDVDRPEDIPIWEQVCKAVRPSPVPGRISVVIPALNEADHISATLDHVARGRNVEVIVVDGGSEDGTAEIALSKGARVLDSSLGRAKQLTAGAAVASGDILLFLHADTRLPEAYDDSIRRTLSEPGVVAGAFELRYDAPLRRLRLIERTANWRARRRQMPYGDQALFVRAATFRELGGFRNIPIMEDFELVRNLRRRGRIKIVRAAVLTSPRRYLTLGPLRTAILNKVIVVAHKLRVSPSRIARWYNR